MHVGQRHLIEDFVAGELHIDTISGEDVEYKQIRPETPFLALQNCYQAPVLGRNECGRGDVSTERSYFRGLADGVSINIPILSVVPFVKVCL